MTGIDHNPTPCLLEASRQTPIVERVDVVVAGGGPAGIAAAIAAARGGATTRLIETHGCLGGVWTSGLLSWILDKDNKRGVMLEVVERLDSLGARRHNAYDAEAMKLLLERLCVEAGVQVRLHTRVVAAARDSANRLAVAITESKSGREAWAAEVFVDCTGDGDLARQAGCGFDLGNAHGETQPMTLMCLLGGVDCEALDRLGLILGGSTDSRAAKAAMKRHLHLAGVTPSYGHPSLFPIRNDLCAMMANHEYGFSALDAQQITDATLRARAENFRLVEALRATGGVWANLRLLATGEQIGIREARRIHGRYTVTEDDLRVGRAHRDAVCRVTFGIDVHSTNPGRSGTHAVERQPFVSKPYDIPYRALLAADVDGLLLAGRCISGDFIAHSSYRVTGNAVAMGEAAGAAAAISAQRRVFPHELDWTTDVEPTLNRLRRGRHRSEDRAHGRGFPGAPNVSSPRPLDVASRH